MAIPSHDECLEKVLSTFEGRMVVRSIINLTGVDECAWCDNAAKRDFLCGRQSVGFDIVSRIKAIKDYEEVWLKFLEDTKKDIIAIEIEDGKND